MKRMQASEPSAKSAVGKRTRVRINNLLDRNGQFRGAGFPDEIEPFVESRAGLCGDFQDPRSGCDVSEVFTRDLPVEVDRVGQVRLRQDHGIGVVKNGRIFLRFVLPLRDGRQDDTAVFPEVEGRGTDEVADVFDEEQIDFSEVEFLDGMQNHVSIEMTDIARGDLDGGHAGFPKAPRIIIRGAISHDDPATNVSGECRDRFGEQSRLTGTGRGDQVEHGDAPAEEESAGSFRQPGVLVEHRPAQFDNAAFVVTMMMMMVMMRRRRVLRRFVARRMIVRGSVIVVVMGFHPSVRMTVGSRRLAATAITAHETRLGSR